MSWQYQEITGKIMGAAVELHKHLGPGLWEVAYQLCLASELENLQLKCQLNFNEPILKKGLRRFVLGAKDIDTSLTQGEVP